jgi:hypothetical protein
MSSNLSPPVCSPLCIAPEEFDYETRKLTTDDLRAEIGYESKFPPEVFQAQLLT